MGTSLASDSCTVEERGAALEKETRNLGRGGAR
jgi:hypothetical protein